jgi:hypothetical protein
MAIEIESVKRNLPRIIALVNKHLDEGWSFHVAMRRAGIPQTKSFYAVKGIPELAAIKKQWEAHRRTECFATNRSIYNVRLGNL